MSSSPLRTGLQTLQSSWRHFGLRQTVLQAGMLGVVAAGRASMALDEVFHREYHDVEVRRPVFIIGAPRSGTTFFHRLLTQTNEFPCWHTWELFVPSLTARNIVHPLVPHVVRVLGKGFQDDSTLMGEAHRTSSDSIEEEEMLFVLRLDSQFVNVFTPVGFDERDHEDLVYADAQPDAQRLASARFLKGCLQRQIAFTGRTQVVAKLPYSTLRVRTLLEVFPDARFVYMARSPFETLPSHMTLHRGFFAQRYGLENIGEERLAA
ncbi:MAG: sulfotransferase, partial [Myxococcales bacterium]|nr:sulfotransferase [Myxococcales bacterium]